MAGQNKSYFDLWLEEKIDNRRDRAKTECIALDRKAAAEKRYYTGRRIGLTVNIISEIFLPLIDKVLGKAVANEPRSERVEIASAALTGLFDELNAMVIQTAKSTAFGKAVLTDSSRTVRAAAELVEPIKRQLLVKIEGARRSARSTVGDRDQVPALPDQPDQFNHGEMLVQRKADAYDQALTACYGRVTPDIATKDVCAKIWSHLQSKGLPRSPQEDSEAHRKMVREAIRRARL